jgi:hypothetical protein
MRDLSAQIVAMRVINSRFLSYEAPIVYLRFSDSIKITRFVDLDKLIKKPFSLKLYIFEGIMSYFSIFS